MFAFVLPIVCCFGFIANLINIVIFSNPQLKEEIFTYLLAYSASNACFTFVTSFCWISRSGSFFAFSSSYESKFYELYLFFTGIYGFGTFTALIELVISYNRLISTKKMFKMSPTKSLSLMLVISGLVALASISTRTIKRDQSHSLQFNVTNTQCTYEIDYSSFGASFQGKFLYGSILIFKNIITLVVLAAVNVKISIQLRQFYAQKSRFFRTKSNPLIEKQSVTMSLKRTQSQYNISKMTLCMFLVYLTCNLTNAVVGFCFLFYSDRHFFAYLIAFADLPQFLGYGVNIFIYYNFNLRYKKVFHSYLTRMRPEKPTRH